jgi:hypothetical protein
MRIDYTTLSGQKDNSPNGRYESRWWAVPKAERAESLAKIMTAIAQYDSKRQTQYQISTRLYGNTNLMGLNGLSMTKIASVNNALKDRMSYNLVQSTVDTVTSKMGKNKPKPLFLTSKGDYKMHRKAKKLDQFVDGVFYENEAYAMGTDVFRDAGVFGDGFVHVFDHYGRVKFEKVMPSELYVDWVEAFYGYPRQLHRGKNVDRTVLMDLFPKHKDKILAANSASADLMGAYQNVADQIFVGESWHLPSGPDATDGLHVIWIDSEILFEEKWEKDHFPFAKFSWGKRMYGYWGQALAEQIQNLQLELNKLLWVVQRSMHLAGTFKVFIKNGSKFPKEHLNNDIGAIIAGNEPPQYIVPPIVQPEVYSHIQTIKTMAYEQAGISQLSAAAQKPAGLNSGKALREYNDIESDRFMTVGQEYERFFMQLAKLSVGVAKDIYEREGSYKVKVPGKKFVETIDWKDVDLQEDQYTMKIFPVSSLPNEPAGRLQTIQEYIQAGFITPRAGRRLLDFPDLEQIEDLQNASEEWIHEVLERIVDDGVYTPPEPYDDLNLASELGLQYYAQGKSLGLEEEKLQLLRNFMAQVNLLKQKALPPPPPVAGGAPGATGVPQANPQPTPTNDMIPNVPGAA